jgi:hypothetical protein
VLGRHIREAKQRHPPALLSRLSHLLVFRKEHVAENVPVEGAFARDFTEACTRAILFEDAGIDGVTKRPLPCSSAIARFAADPDALAVIWQKRDAGPDQGFLDGLDTLLAR